MDPLDMHRFSSITSVSNVSGTSVESYRYRAFGTIPSTTGAFLTDRGFTGQIRDGGAANWRVDLLYGGAGSMS